VAHPLVLRLEDEGLGEEHPGDGHHRHQEEKHLRGGKKKRFLGKKIKKG